MGSIRDHSSSRYIMQRATCFVFVKFMGVATKYITCSSHHVCHYSVLMIIIMMQQAVYGSTYSKSLMHSTYPLSVTNCVDQG